jgi:transposase InsO family protein
VDFIRDLAALTELPVTRLIGWAGLPKGKFYDWKQRYGKVNEHNAHIPRDHWLTAQEQQAILDYHWRNPLEGYRRLTFMMIDEDVVAASPSSVYRVLRAHNRLDRWNQVPSKKGTGFVQPLRPHQHWHIDIAYINIAGTFYYLCSVLDGCSRAIIHWEIRESMKEADVELVVERAREIHPGVQPRIISDNGPQFIAKDFKAYIRLTGMTHVRTSPYYPQSNGKIERWHKTLKHETIRIKSPSTLEEARTTVAAFVDHYNNRRLHSALGYIAPADRLADKQQAIWASRDRKLEQARERRAEERRAARATKAVDAPLQMRA